MFKRKHLSLFLLLATLALVASSCVKDVILDAGDRTVVVECILCDVPQQELRLSFSKGASESSVEELTEAVVRLIDLTETQTVGEFKRDSDGIWRLDYTAIPLHRYRLEVEVLGFEMVYAEDTMPDIVTIQTYNGVAVNMDDWERRHNPIIPKGATRTSSGNVWFSYPTALDYSGTPNPHALGNNIWVYGMSFNSATGKYELADKICCNLENNVYVNNYNITDEVYRAPKIPTNFPFKYGNDIYPTYLSVFPTLDGSPIYRGFLKIEEPDLACVYLRIWCSFLDMETIKKDFTALANSDLNFSERVLRLMSLREYLTDIEGAILNCEFEPSLSDGYIVFKYVSDTYDKYFEEALFQLRRQDKESADMSEMSIYMRENIYSNVKGGAGIFATSTEKRFHIPIVPDIIYDFSNPL